MGFSEAIKVGLNKFFTPTGRASRSEFWWYALFLYIIGGVIGWFGGRLMFHGMEQVWLGIIFEVLNAVLFVSLVCATIRRLHDTGRSGLYAILYVPLVITWIILVVLCCFPSEKGSNKYGPEPK
ncbi:MAG: DUF805 domain-containing protein [Muribaculaceae bacterium]|nr:DUF805 domain-containing protein [Muribaculaceae bacterium]